VVFFVDEHVRICDARRISESLVYFEIHKYNRTNSQHDYLCISSDGIVNMIISVFHPIICIVTPLGLLSGVGIISEKYVYIYICIYIYMCMYLHTNKQSHTHKDTHTHTTHTHTHTHTHSDTYKHIFVCMCVCVCVCACEYT